MTRLRTCNNRSRRSVRRASGHSRPLTALRIAIRRQLNGPRIAITSIITSSGCGSAPEVDEARRREIDDAIRARSQVIVFERD